ncbi:MAG: hypothetical protein JXR46_07000 [Calditrichaceae bacterium]|nr:hypothetical protein [Calditrichaceae bacterium]MBN2708777.1 hypothetical protein [Calditrichaceae bacterium]RQV97692.1 MAG: carbohydrate kinase family protein [Calditrichota bacterium]
MNIPLFVLGDFAWDVIISPDHKLHSGSDVIGKVQLLPGGSAANTAVWASRCGLKTAFCGKVGADPLGKLAEENLINEGVQALLKTSADYPTEVVAVWVDQQGKKSTVSGKGADFYLEAEELPYEILKTSEHIHISAWSLFTDPPKSASLKAADVVHTNGGKVSLDPASYQMIKEVGVDKCIEIFKEMKPDIFFPNYDEGVVLTSQVVPEKIIERLVKIFDGALLCLKLDDRGALICDNNSMFHIAPVPGKLSDDTGAGDSFAGAFLSHYLRSKDIMLAGELAVCVSSWTVERYGARPVPDQLLIDRINQKKFQII